MRAPDEQEAGTGTCTLCKSPYSYSGMWIALACGHAFCEWCTSTLPQSVTAGGERMLTCPECRAPTLRQSPGAPKDLQAQQQQLIAHLKHQASLNDPFTAQVRPMHPVAQATVFGIGGKPGGRVVAFRCAWGLS
jgi:hypothetical protein